MALKNHRRNYDIELNLIESLNVIIPFSKPAARPA